MLVLVSHTKDRSQLNVFIMLYTGFLGREEVWDSWFESYRGVVRALCKPQTFLSTSCASRGGRGFGGPPGVSQDRMETGMEGGSEAETGELLPVSLGRGPGECSMCRGLVGGPLFPPSSSVG